MGWLSYRNNLRVLEEKIVEELTSLAGSAAREVDLWIKEKEYDVRVFASSYEVSENLDRISRDATSRGAAVDRLHDYLKSVERRFPGYDELAVLDLEGEVVATSAEEPAPFDFPEGWMEKVKGGQRILGKPQRLAGDPAPSMLLAEPVRDDRQQVLGIVAARLNFSGIQPHLARLRSSDADRLYVITQQGMILNTSPRLETPDGLPDFPAATTLALFAKKIRPVEFASLRGDNVVGALEKTSRLDWGLVAEKSRKAEYAAVVRLRNVTLLLVLASLTLVGLAAWLLGLTLVVPLTRLTRGAAKVAAGDLAVDLPVRSRGEIGYLTVVFNRMVARLKKAREDLDATNQELMEKNEELHELSITDGLTSLHNRKHMNETVASEMNRAKRHEHPVSVVMMDIDLFKTFNDTRGHQAGDEVIRGVARVLKETIRNTDYAARYGGEEFLALLPYTGPDLAVQTAERVRTAVEEAGLGEDADGRGITVSLGVASYPECGGDAEAVIREADIALYKAKREGRNRVVQARSDWEETGKEGS